jgi:hypothetical protein
MVEVVPVGVGDQECIEFAQVLDGGDRDPAAHVEDAGAQQGVGQQPDAGELDEHRRMPNVGERAAVSRHYDVALTGSCSASGTGASWSSRRQPLRTSCTLAAPMIGSGGGGRTSG